MKRTFQTAAAVLLLCLAPAYAYQFIEFENPRGELVVLEWPSDSIPVPWHFNDTPPRDFSLQAAQAAAEEAFGRWEAVPTATIQFAFQGTTSAEPFVLFDFINTLGFSDDPDLEDSGILGQTTWIIDTVTGEIAESDILFSNFVPWSVAPEGSIAGFDFHSVVTHEIGHFLGLGHSAVGIMETSGQGRRLLEGSATMYPFAFPRGSILGRTLTPDDVTGVSVLYPTAEFSQQTGAISGRVTRNAVGVFGAHVLTFNPFTGELIGSFTGEGGRYRIEGLKPGPHIVRVGPIEDPTSPEDFGFDERRIDLDFRDEFFEGSAPVTPSGATTDVDVEVES